ncbi:MAG: LptF/LptG family permease [Alphaproteobacteria bacterium]|nr:LptF/LptG family permease [Alphaproteobacteria bacterium]
MDRLTRYVFRQALMVTLSVGVIFSAAVWLLQSLRLVDLIVNRGLSIGLFLYLAVLILPRFIDVVLPIAIFTAILFVYAKLISESELVVMRASGMSQWGLAKPALLIGAAGMIALYAMAFYFLPASNRAFKDLQFEIRNKFAAALIQEGVFNTLSDTLMVYVRKRDARGDLLGLLIQNTTDRDKPVTISAERGALVDTPDGPHILMVNGIRQEYDHLTGKLSSLSFKSYTLDLTDLRNAPTLRDRQPDELYLGEILKDLDNPALVVELNMRLAGPLMALSMAVIPILCLLPGEFNRRGQARRVLIAVAVALAMEIVDVGLTNLARSTTSVISLIYLNALAPFLATLWLTWRAGAVRTPRALLARRAVR